VPSSSLSPALLLRVFFLLLGREDMGLSSLVLLCVATVAAEAPRPFVVRVTGQHAPNGARLSHAQQPPAERRGIAIHSPRMGEIVSHTGYVRSVVDGKTREELMIVAARPS
jgi:hypothetical protein